MKITDEQFLAMLRANSGLYAKTAKAIRDTYGVEYTRQAVRDRAAKFLEELEDIREETKDYAEETLLDLMGKDKDDRVRFSAAQLYLKTVGKDRGYVERLEKDITTNGESLNKIDVKQLSNETLEELASLLNEGSQE